ncbi:MAG: MiaB/RimO family radical SAM methylthiotransferase [Candidatus Nanopelagicales bacterium]|jgi:ribosomal protein S12 methylthiotransferase
MDPRVAVLRLGCARNDVDADELESRLTADGLALSDEVDGADVLLVNTCGFVASAKKDSIDAVLAAADTGARVIVTGCLAERYGAELAESLPEAAAVLSFDDYADIADRVRRVAAGEALEAHTPVDRRTLLPIAPVERVAADAPGHGGLARRITGPVMSVKLASGCDRRCTFCAIPSFRGSFVSRRPEQVIGEIADLADAGVREVVLVSENSTSYGKDLGDIRMLEALLPALARVPGILRVRLNYLQPAEIRPGLVDVIAGTPGVAPYFDLSFQHASTTVLRRMRRFGGTDDFLALLDTIRSRNPQAGVRTNVIVGFPGETEADLDELVSFLEAARMDAIGVFGYSDEEGTEAMHLDGHLTEEEIERRVSRVSRLVDELMLERAAERVGEEVELLVEEPGLARAAHQGPDDAATIIDAHHAVGEVLRGRIVDVDGVDLVAAVP